MPRDLARALLQVPEWIAQGDDAALDQLVGDLSWYPDGPGFEWLCALAVYPAATYDLALYLGTQMRLQSAGSTGAMLFTPARLAALTRLEWLRVGRIPDPIRRRLAARLSSERSREVRGLIQRLIEDADAQGAQPVASRAAYAREEASAGPPPERLYEDEVFVDFMRAGQVDELAVDVPEARPASWKEQLREIDWLRIGAVVLVWGYAIAAWLATPDRDERPDDPLAWLPLVALELSAAATVLALRPVSAWLRLRSMAWQFATGGLVTALVAANALAARLGWGVWTGDPGARLLVGLVIAIVSWPVCWWTFGRFARDDWSPQPRVGAILKLALQAVAGGALAVGITAFASSLGGAAPYALAVPVVGGPLLAWGCARLPAKTPAKAQPDLTRLHRARPLARRAHFALGLVLLAGCLWLAHATDAARETLPGGASADRLVAATEHGLLATTQAGEEGVIITSAADPAHTLRHIVFRPASRSGARSSTGAAEPFRIAAMALTDAGADGRPKLVASSSTGAVVAVDGALPPKLVVAAARRGALLAAPVLAVNAQGTVLAAHKFDDRIDITLTDMAAKTAYTLHLPDAPRMTAAAPAGTGCFVWTLANGAVGALRVERRAGVITGIWLPPHPGWRQERLAGGARLIRPMGGTGGTSRFLLVADDGTAAHLTLDCQTGYGTRRVAAMPELKLGDMPAWRDREAVAATSPIVPPTSQEAAPSQRGASTTASKIANTVAVTTDVLTLQEDGNRLLTVADDQLNCTICELSPLAAGLGRRTLAAPPIAIVVHDTGSPGSALKLVMTGLAHLRGPLTHVLIARDGTIYQVARFNEMVSHTGVTKDWNGVQVRNSTAIGIELDHAAGEDYPGAQLRALSDVVDLLMRSYPIRALVGHKEVAAGRKSDPELDMLALRHQLGISSAAPIGSRTAPVTQPRGSKAPAKD
jgi:hypothetical protein